MRKTLRLSWVLLLSLLLLAGTSALADSCPLAIVDENGNGSLNFTVGGGCGSGALVSMPGVLAADPGPGGLASVLTYNLLGPPGLVAGDVLLIDPDFGIRLDVIRFNPFDPATGYAASLLFYSDNVDGFDALGDTSGPPGLFYPNVVSIPEVGDEINNGAFYIPGPNDPGFVPGFNVKYEFISDGLGPVPEPSSLMLFGTGIIGVAGVVRRKLLG